MLYEPSLKTYNKLYNIIKGKNTKYKNLYFTNDEFFYIFFRKMNFIDNRFSSNIFSKKYPYLEYIFGIKYNGKPFLLDEKKKILKYKEYKLCKIL